MHGTWPHTKRSAKTYPHSYQRQHMKHIMQKCLRMCLLLHTSHWSVLKLECARTQGLFISYCLFNWTQEMFNVFLSHKFQSYWQTNQGKVYSVAGFFPKLEDLWNYLGHFHFKRHTKIVTGNRPSNSFSLLSCQGFLTYVFNNVRPKTSRWKYSELIQLVIYQESE